MRLRLALPVALLAGALALTGCSSDSATGDETDPSATETTQEGTESGEDAGQTPSAEATIAGNESGFTATGEFGDKPELTFGASGAPEGLQVETITEGDGPVVEQGAYVVAHYLGQVWDGETAFDNSYDRGAPSGFSLDGVVQGWSIGLVGQHVGSRVQLTIPSELGYPTGNEGAGIAAGDTIVFVVDIVGAYGPNTSGQADATPTDVDTGIVVTGDAGHPVEKVEVTEGATEPTEPTATVLAEGTGEELAEGSSALLQYTLTTWDNSSAETTWPELGGFGMYTATLGQGTVFDSLVSVPVGSRVLLTIPADTATGQPALAVVIDVVALVS